MLAVVRSRGLSALVEIHDEIEAALALESGAQAVGVNHRDLRTFEVDLRLPERLRPLLPDDVALVAESGIHSGAAARRLREAGRGSGLVAGMLMYAPECGRCPRCVRS